jgi:ribosomal protein S12 methylthiotransferase accessory factor
MRRPRFRADYLPVPVPGGLLVVGEGRHVLIEDPAAAAVASALDGTRPLAEVLATGDPTATARVLRRLAALGLLTEDPVSVDPPRAAAWDARAVPPDAAEAWLRTGTVTLVDAGSPLCDALATSLATTGLHVRVVPVDAPDLESHLTAGAVAVVVVAGSVVDARIGRVDAACRAAGRDWTLVRPHGNEVLLGPHFVPGGTGCWHCLARRWTENAQVESFLGLAGTPVLAALPALAMAAAGLLLAELPVIVHSGQSPRLTGQLLALDTRDLTTATHRLARAPQCPACGTPDLLAKAGPRITLTPDREDVTWTDLESEVSRYLGVVTRLAPLDRAEGLLYGYRAGHHFPPTRTLGTLRENLRGHSGGHGPTETDAKISAVAEAIERYSGVWRDDRPTHVASFAQLGPDRAVPPRDLLLFSPDQYAQREQTNPTLSHFHHTPLALPDERPIAWTTGWSLTHDRPRELPAAYCWYGHPDLSYCAADSNGCAAGHSVTDAVLRGFVELVERDSVALWWYHRSRLPAVDLDSFDDPWIAALRRRYGRTLGRSLWVLDITADLGIPAYAAVSANGDEDVLVGFGAHLDPRVGVRRALLEVSQFLPIRRTALDNPDARRWFTETRVSGQPWLRPDPDQRPSTVDTHRDLSTGDVAADANRCVAIAGRAGLETIVVDQTRPDLPLAVVKVVVPGLRHFWRRLGPGRLWDVPARLGRAPLATGEEDVNPVNVFF